MSSTVRFTYYFIDEAPIKCNNVCSLCENEATLIVIPDKLYAAYEFCDSCFQKDYNIDMITVNCIPVNDINKKYSDVCSFCDNPTEYVTISNSVYSEYELCSECVQRIK